MNDTLTPQHPAMDGMDRVDGVDVMDGWWGGSQKWGFTP